MNIDLEADLTALRAQLADALAREQDLRDFLDNASVGVHAVGPDGTILWANDAELALLGYSRDEYVGHHIREFHADETVIEDILRRLNSREMLWNYEARLRGKDGGIRHVLINSNVRWNGPEFLHTRCFTRDITDRKRYEKRLQLQYEMGRILVDAAALPEAAPGILRLVAEHLESCAGLLWTPDGDVLRCTASWEEAAPRANSVVALSREYQFATGVGLPGRVWAGKKPVWIRDLREDRNFPRMRLVAECGLRSALAIPIVIRDTVLGVIEFFAKEVRPPDQDLLELAETLGAQLGEFIERTNDQRRLAESEESYRVLTETATDGVITIDERSTILLVNSAAAAIFGYTQDELKGGDLTRLMPEYLREVHKAALSTYLETGRRHTSWHSVPVIGEHRDGHEIPLEVSFGEYRRGNRRTFVGILRDVSERKRMDDKLRQIAKLESLGVLAGGIAHDFNNLLTGILGNVSLAMEMIEDGDTAPAAGVLQNAVEASERAAHLTRQLLAYAGKGRFLVEPIDLSALVRQISTLVKSSIPKHVRLRLDLEDPLPAVDADVAQMQQLIMNLVINAAEAVPEGEAGVVLVSTMAQDADAAYLEQTFGEEGLAPGSYVALTVQDTGAGMDDATVQRIFDPFFTTKFAGRGLGLAAVLGIVRGHKGAMRVFSTRGEGTTFRVLLPVAAKTAAGTDDKPASSGIGGSGTVLVVDDELVVRKLAAASLERHGYQVITAEDGLQGVERFAESHDRLSIVLLDMTMPVMSGEEALRRIRRIDPKIPVVLSSGYSEGEAIRRFAGHGLAGFIQKPYTSAGLAEKIRVVLLESDAAQALGRD